MSVKYCKCGALIVRVKGRNWCAMKYARHLAMHAARRAK